MLSRNEEQFIEELEASIKLKAHIKRCLLKMHKLCRVQASSYISKINRKEISLEDINNFIFLSASIKNLNMDNNPCIGIGVSNKYKNV